MLPLGQQASMFATDTAAARPAGDDESKLYENPNSAVEYAEFAEHLEENPPSRLGGGEEEEDDDDEELEVNLNEQRPVTEEEVST